MKVFFSFIRLLWSAIFANKQHRYESQYQLFVVLTHFFGFRLYNKNLVWIYDEEYIAAWQKFPMSKKGRMFIHERKFNLFNLARSIRSVEGDIAECGVFHGGSSHLMLTATDGTSKHLFGFDSFEGLSEPKESDYVTQKHTFKWKKHDMSFDENTTRKNLEKFNGRFSLYKGWIPERFNEVSQNRFSLVHIDVDLYEPTMSSIEFFYPRLSVGGFIVCDDYGSEACPGAKKAMDEYAASIGAKVVHLTTGQGILFKTTK
jgi:hypothetical protein